MSIPVEVDPENECFFVTPIGEEGTPTRKQADTVGKYIVGRAAGQLGLTLTRADWLAEAGQISHQVIEHVVTAKGVVADLSNSNPNVYYELALRHGAQKPVVLIAHKDHMPHLAFDVSAERVIPYDHRDFESAEKVVDEIVKQLRKAIKGPVVSPVGTALNFGRLDSGDPTQAAIATLTTQVASMARDLRRLGNAVSHRDTSRRGEGTHNFFVTHPGEEAEDLRIAVEAVAIDDDSYFVTAQREGAEPTRWISWAENVTDLINEVSERIPPLPVTDEGPTSL